MRLVGYSLNGPVESRFSFVCRLCVLVRRVPSWQTVGWRLQVSDLVRTYFLCPSFSKSNCLYTCTRSSYARGGYKRKRSNKGNTKLFFLCCTQEASNHCICGIISCVLVRRVPSWQTVGFIFPSQTACIHVHVAVMQEQATKGNREQ